MSRHFLLLSRLPLNGPRAVNSDSNVIVVCFDQCHKVLQEVLTFSMTVVVSLKGRSLDTLVVEVTSQDRPWGLG